MALITNASRWIIPLLVTLIPLYATFKKVNVYEAFVQGAEEGVRTAVRILPFLLVMLVSIDVFRNSGAMEYIARALSPFTRATGIPAEIIPLAFLRPISGGAALAVATELIHTHGPDSYVGRLASTMQGSTDTTFYVVTVYFGSVGIMRYRYAPVLGLIADGTTFAMAVIITRLVFGSD